MKRPRWNKRILLLGLAAALAANGFVREAKAADREIGGREAAKAAVAAKPRTEPRPGLQAPVIALKGLDGSEYRIGGAREKPLLLNFWDSSCPPCGEEAADLVRIHRTFGDRIEMYAVNVTAQDSRAEAAAFAAKNGYAFPVLLDEQGEATRLYRVRGLPTTFLIGKDGVIRDAFYLLDSAQWEPKIAEWLKG